ncbi:chitobiase/beta-hexosaminidase C-terminal domain-containing protein, partial [candidate division KSB1 bacterium]|nr:chitobiase/beta-hexosaminidase C-terminal domain-containing protein [candidate division KSB1 bacterium]
QTVWIEPVNKANIKSIKIVPDIDAGIVNLTTITSAPAADFNILLQVKADGKTIKELITQAGKTAFIPLKNPKLWSPDSPFLYDLIVILQDEKGNKLDEINSYFGMRKIALGKDENGFTRLMLNNEFVFQFGPLDQGWWPDGLYTAPSDEALRYDIEVTKKLGFNMARKHVKIEPDRWYYWCDKLGLLVWQDMPSGDKYIRPDQPDIKRSTESANQFEFELKQLVNNFGNHPSIVLWVPFNEGWGQYDTPRIVDYIKTLDPTRLVINTSGWSDRGVGDVYDIHSYPGPAMPNPEESRAIVLGEFGGLGLPVKGHTWQDENNWGYRSYKDADELTAAYRELIKKLYPFVVDGLSAAVYTQTTDVEIEVNGLMTYDRAIIKMDPDEVHKINLGYLAPVIVSENDIFIETAEVTIKNIKQHGEIHYTMDGSVPDQNSSLYDKPIAINKKTTVKAITLWDDGTKSSVSEQTYKKVKLRKSQKITAKKPGILFDYFENDSAQWNKLPNFDRLTPKANDVAFKMDLAQRFREDNFGFVYNGLFRAQKDGIYTFYTNSDDGSQLYINSELIVDNDKVHGMVEKSGQIALQAGFFPIKVIFFQGRGGKGLKVSYKGPAMMKQEMLSTVLFHE